MTTAGHITTRAAADQLTIGIVVGGMTLLVCPLIGAYAGFIAGKNQIRRLQDTRPPQQHRQPLRTDAFRSPAVKVAS